jgi:hypothetical protein
MSNKIIKLLPFWETVGRSFKYVLKNKKLLVALLPVVGALFVLQIALGLPFMCSYNASFCMQNWQHTTSVVFLMFAVIGIIINYCLSIICKETVDFYSVKFVKRASLYILWSFLMTFLVGAPLILIVALLLTLGVAENIVLMSSLFLFFVLGTIFAPLMVAFPALSVDDYKLIKVSKLFQLAKGNKMRIFFGQFIVMIPYILLSKMVAYIYALMGINNYALNLCFVLIAVGLSVLDAGFKGAFYAHIYQFLKYYDKDK